MKIVIQRVKQAQVSIEDQVHNKISSGFLLLVGVGPDDGPDDLDYAVRKIVNMRIFSDQEGRMNLSVKDIEGEILSISQFTLHADTKKGNRPAFVKAAPPELASRLYDEFNQLLAQEVPTKTGLFGADMQVELVNDGPVTIILDTKNRWEEVWKGVWTLVFKLLIFFRFCRNELLASEYITKNYQTFLEEWLLWWSSLADW